MPIEVVKPVQCERGFKPYSPTGALPCRSRHDGGGHRDEKTRPAAMPTRKAVSAVIAPSLGFATNTVCAEIFAHHKVDSLSCRRVAPQRGHAC